MFRTHQISNNKRELLYLWQQQASVRPNCDIREAQIQLSEAVLPIWWRPWNMNSAPLPLIFALFDHQGETQRRLSSWQDQINKSTVMIKRATRQRTLNNHAEKRRRRRKSCLLCLSLMSELCWDEFLLCCSVNTAITPPRLCTSSPTLPSNHLTGASATQVKLDLKF